jgi:hypothetical protein
MGKAYAGPRSRRGASEIKLIEAFYADARDLVAELCADSDAAASALVQMRAADLTSVTGSPPVDSDASGVDLVTLDGIITMLEGPEGLKEP